MKQESEKKMQQHLN